MTRERIVKRLLQCVVAAASCWLFTPWIAVCVVTLSPLPARHFVYCCTDYTVLPPRCFTTRSISAAFYPVACFFESDLSGSFISRDIFQWVESLRYRAHAE